MNKIIMFLLMTGLILTGSCKNENTSVEDTTKEISEQPATEETEVQKKFNEEIKKLDTSAEFQNPELKEFARGYLGFAKLLKEAADEGDEIKVRDLQRRNLVLAEKIQDFNQQLSPEEAEQFKAWIKEVAETFSIN